MLALKNITKPSFAATMKAKHRLWEAPEPPSKMPTKVNSLWLNPRLMIAFHSPDVLLETGLHMCPPEKSRDSAPDLS